MSITEKTLKAAVVNVEKRIKYLDDILKANPYSDLLEVRKQAKIVLTENKGDYEKIAKLLAPLAEKEKKAFSMVKKQKNTLKLIDEKAALSNERNELINELSRFYIRKRVSA